MNLVALFLITILGLLLRIHSISPFKLYPDSYQNLLVAENIRSFHSVIGRLGEHGMFYPDFFMWTRPMYALLIDLVHMTGIDTTLAAQSIAFIAGTLAIPLAYLFIKSIFQSKPTGLAGATLLALSYNHTVWSGFIMTETTGVLFMLLTLWSFFASLKKKSSAHDYLTGLLVAFSVMTRYEYAIILLPMLFFILLTEKQPYYRLGKIFTTFLFATAIVGIQLFPPQAVSVLLNQLPDLLVLGGGLGAITLTTLIIKKYSSGKGETRIEKLSTRLTLHSNDKLLAIFLLALLFFLITSTGAIGAFIKHDFFLSLCFLFGVTFMLQQKQLRKFGYFSIGSIIFLTIFYYRTNPEMERYMTHLIPFILIPGSYGLKKILSFSFQKRTRLRYVYIFCFIFLLFTQIFISFNGLRYLHDDSWYRVSYEQKAAEKVQQYVSKEELLLVSLPEPYFYVTKKSTHSIADTPPYMYIPDSLNNKTIIIVEDMGMHEIFPNFTNFLKIHMQDKKVAKFSINEQFHILNKSKQEAHPLVIYKTTVKELKDRLKNVHLNP